MPGIKRAAGVKAEDPIELRKKQKVLLRNTNPTARESTWSSSEGDDASPVGTALSYQDERDPSQLKMPRPAKRMAASSANRQDSETKKQKLEVSSAEAHARQRALAKERKAAKPNSDLIARSKKIWEQLRRKSHVPLEERKRLLDELYAIVNGRVRDFVFKHDSVRVIQCALKYANKEQRLNITRELQSDLRALVESKYGKFMVAKIVVEGDQEIKNLVIPEFYGHIRRLINHPEAAWIVDDIYRQVATAEQKAIMLREWYGAEFALDNKVKEKTLKSNERLTSDLKRILDENPEKRKPIMHYLYQLINQLVQKKMTGFTMLHDAMYQYFTNTPTGSEEANEFLENLKSDLDDPSGGGDLLKNLAFTKYGSKVVCLALAYGAAKDRKQIIRVYRENIEAMAFDAHAHTVLLTALEVTDDTKMSGKSIYSELLFEHVKDEVERDDRLTALLLHRTARLPLLYPLAGAAKWLVTPDISSLLTEVHAIRETTSKKAGVTRHAELAAYLCSPLVSLVARRAPALASTILGCPAVAEIILASPSHVTAEERQRACAALASICAGDPTDEKHISHAPHCGKMLRSLCHGGRFDPKLKTIVKPPETLGFAKELFGVIKDDLVKWATGPSSFVIVAMVESDELGDLREEAIETLKEEEGELRKAAEKNAGAKLLVDHLSSL